MEGEEICASCRDRSWEGSEAEAKTQGAQPEQLKMLKRFSDQGSGSGYLKGGLPPLFEIRLCFLASLTAVSHQISLFHTSAQTLMQNINIFL